MITRDERRHRRSRAVERMRHYIKTWFSGTPEMDAQSIDRMAKRLADNPHPCSRRCCANLRRFEGPTRRELRQAER